MGFLLGILRRLGLFLVGFTVPLGAFTIFDFGYRATPFKLATAGLLLLAVAQLMLTGRMPRRDSKAIWVLAFAASYGIALMMSLMYGMPLSSVIIVATTVYSLILYYFLLNYIISDLRELLSLLWGFVMGAAVTSLPAALGAQEAEVVIEGAERLPGLSGQVNVLGFDTMISLPIVAVLFMMARRPLARIILIGAGAFALMGMLASLSRTAFVSTAGIWALWAYRFRRLDSIKYVIPALAVAGLLMVAAPEGATQRVASLIDPAERAADESIGARLRQFEASLIAIVRNPVLGLGTRRFVAWAKEQPDVPHVHNMVHNAYLRVGVEQGLLGLVCFLGILTIAWQQYSATWRLARAHRGREDRELTELGFYGMFLQFSLFGMLIGGMFTHSQDSKTGWMILALSPVVLNLARMRVQQFKASDRVQEAAELPPAEPLEPAVPGHAAARRSV